MEKLPIWVWLNQLHYYQYSQVWAKLESNKSPKTVNEFWPTQPTIKYELIPEFIEPCGRIWDGPF